MGHSFGVSIALIGRRRLYLSQPGNTLGQVLVVCDGGFASGLRSHPRYVSCWNSHWITVGQESVRTCGHSASAFCRNNLVSCLHHLLHFNSAFRPDSDGAWHRRSHFCLCPHSSRRGFVRERLSCAMSLRN